MTTERLLGYFDVDNERQDTECYLVGNELFQQPVGDRVLVMERPPDRQSIGGIIIPDKSVKSQVFGVIVAAGLSALDKMHDAGLAIGDEVGWSKYAGVMTEWKRLVVVGEADCKHDWGSMNRPEGTPNRYRCLKCPAVLRIENMVVLNVDDLHGSRQLAERLRSGELRIDFVPGDDSRPNQHVMTRSE